MNCVTSTYDASGKLVGCTQQELTSLISVQMYTLFALGTGLCLYKTFTAENWVDIAVTIGWGCVTTFTRTKRVVTKYVLPCLRTAFQTLTVSDTTRTATATSMEDDVTEDLIRVVRDGVETSAYSSVFEFVHDLDARFKSAVVDEDVINVHLCDTETETEEPETETEEPETETKPDAIDIKDETESHEEEEEEEEEEDESEEDESEEDESEEEEDISELLTRIENHTMQFDFMLSRVPTAAHLGNDSKKEGGHVMKYDGFPRDSLGVHFSDRKFVPVDHRMMEVVLQLEEGKDYDLNLASPDNFYVAGNKLLDPAFVKWFMLKNHGVKISTGHDKCNYVIKCVDHTAALHTLRPHNYLHVSVSGFEVQDSGLV